MNRAILLGYEIGTGEPVSIPIAHLCVTGQTQIAGKTTTLEALIDRSALRALTFVTKRGESAFRQASRIRPYFRERADWQYVSAILEATLRERLKFERSWIMQVCKGATSLEDVQRNIERDLAKARGLNQSVLTTLHAYLELILPQITRTTFAPAIALSPGINVMDLSEFRLELQSLIIRSALEWVYEREENTIVIIPEAWEFIPQNRSSPVKLAAEQLIRKGGALHNYVWLDSQDIAAVHNDILRSASVWILGAQRERNEVNRVLDHITGAKPKAGDIMQLGIGEFYACHGKEVRRVYVQPAWMDAEKARAHSLGAPLPEKPMRTESDEEMAYKQKYEDLKAEFDKLQTELQTLKLAHGMRGSQSPAQLAPAPPDLDTIYAHVKTRLLQEQDPGILSLLARKPEIHIKVQRPVLEMDDSTLRGRLVRLIAEGFFDSPTTANAAFNELKRLGQPVAKPNVYREMEKLAEMRIVTLEANGYQKAPDAVVKTVAA